MRTMVAHSLSNFTNIGSVKSNNLQRISSIKIWKLRHMFGLRNNPIIEKKVDLTKFFKNIESKISKFPHCVTYSFSSFGSCTKASGWISLRGLPLNSISRKFGLFCKRPSGIWSIRFSPRSLRIKWKQYFRKTFPTHISPYRKKYRFWNLHSPCQKAIFLQSCNF